MTWERKTDLPVVTSSSQIVIINDFVFVSGGRRNIPDIFQYSASANTWTTLPQCPAIHQGLATLNGELISVGGMNSQGSVTNIVYNFRDGEWKEVLPPMPTPRHLLSTVSHNNELIIAAGGRTGGLRTRVVEIFIRGRQWYVTKQLCFPLSTASTCVIHDTCYMLGGAGERAKDSFVTLYVSLPDLIEDATSLVQENKGVWKSLKTEYPLYLSSIVELEGKLTALGGSYDEVYRRGTRLISTYDFAADVWVECQGAQLPVPLYKTGVMKLAGNKVMIIGGQSEKQQFSNEVYIGSYNKN